MRAGSKAKHLPAKRPSPSLAQECLIKFEVGPAHRLFQIELGLSHRFVIRIVPGELKPEHHQALIRLNLNREIETEINSKVHSLA
jgi:hypothetical protein